MNGTFGEFVKRHSLPIGVGLMFLLTWPIDLAHAGKLQLQTPFVVYLSAYLPMFIVPFFLVDAISNGEEIGWRGYVLPRLQVRHSALVSSLILGVVWGFWHLPKFLGEDSSPFWLFRIRVTASAVLYTWLFNNTNGSLLMTTLFHASVNTAGVFLPIANTAVGSNVNALMIQAGLEVFAAIAVTLFAGADRLSRTQPKQILNAEARI